MEQFVSFAWIGGVSIVTILLWRLYVAVDTQRKLEQSLAATMDTLEIERQDLGALIRSQTDTIEALTDENQDLKRRLESHLIAFSQLQADHQTLQEKYAELEQDLLDKIAKGKNLTENLQVNKLEQARLHRQVESAHKQQVQQAKEQQSLRLQHQKVTDKNQLYQKAVQAAKVKIEALKHDKKQLERELQQALQQVVALEQDYTLDSETRLQHALSVISSTDKMIEPSLPRFE